MASPSWAVYRLARWAFVTVDWEIVRANLRLFMVGRYPSDQLWRPWASGYVIAATVGMAGRHAGRATRRRRGRPATRSAPRPARRGRPAGARRRLHRAGRRCWLSLTRAFTCTDRATVGLVAVVLARSAGARHPPARGCAAGLLVVAGVAAVAAGMLAGGRRRLGRWGGLHLAVAATVAGIALAFPLGLPLALGPALVAARASGPCRSATSRRSGRCRSSPCCSSAGT